MLWVAAQANGHVVNGIIDSDSEETFLDPQTVRLFGLEAPSESLTSMKVETIGGVVSSRIAFELGNVVVLPERLMIAPLKRQFPEMDFILGLDAVGKTPFTVDYSKSTIEFGHVPEGPKTPFLPGRDVPSVTVRFSSASVCAFVDTGAPCALDLPFGWVRSKLPATSFGPANEREDLGPRFETLPFMLGEIAIGENRLPDVRAEAVRRKSNPPQDSDDEVWGSLGNQVLARFAQIGIDGPSRNCVFRLEQ